MRKTALAIAFLAGLLAPALAQKAEIEAANAKWIELFNKGDFAGVASLYTKDAFAFPPGAAMVKGREAIGAMWKGFAEQVSDPKLTTLDVKALGPSAAREIGTVKPQDQKRDAAGGRREICRAVGKDRRRLEDRDRHLERQQVAIFHGLKNFDGRPPVHRDASQFKRQDGDEIFIGWVYYPLHHRLKFCSAGVGG